MWSLLISLFAGLLTRSTFLSHVWFGDIFPPVSSGNTRTWASSSILTTSSITEGLNWCHRKCAASNSNSDSRSLERAICSVGSTKRSICFKAYCSVGAVNLAFHIWAWKPKRPKYCKTILVLWVLALFVRVSSRSKRKAAFSFHLKAFASRKD